MAQYPIFQGATQSIHPDYAAPMSASSRPPTELESGAHRIEALSNQAGMLADRLEALGDRIFGGSPQGQQASAAKGPQAVPNGILQAMGEVLSDLSLRLNCIEEQANRLERLA